MFRLKIHRQTKLGSQMRTATLHRTSWFLAQPDDDF